MVRSAYFFVAVEVQVQKLYNKTFNVRSLQKPVTFVFLRVLMFPSTSSQGSDIKCIVAKTKQKKKLRLPTKLPKKSHVEFLSLIKVSESCADNCIINGLIPSPSWFETRQ